MPHEIIMPALGMAQDTGRLVRWLAAPGSRVRAGDPLFEVETDKTTMEVEAQADGWLGAVGAEAGQDIPVGQVIAVLGDAPAGIAPLSQPVAAPALPVVPPPAAALPAPAAIHPPRILASPKARRLAAEAGLDLGALVRAGHPQPYHAADIDRLRAVGRDVAPVAAAVLHIDACIPRAGIDGFVRRMLDEGRLRLDPAALWLAFAAAAMRRASRHSGDLVVELAPFEGAPRRLRNPDHARLSAQPEAGDVPPHLILRDLTATCITGVRLSARAVPVLSITLDGDALRLGLDFTAGQLDEAAALGLVTDVAQRLADPLTHLV